MRRLLDFFATPAGRAARYACSVLLLGAFVASIDWANFATLRGRVAPGPAGLQCRSLGKFALRGVAEPEEVFALA